MFTMFPMRRALSRLPRSFHTTSASSFYNSPFRCSKDAPPPPPPVSEAEEQPSTEEPTSPPSTTIVTDLNVPSNLSIEDPFVLEPATPLDVHGANRGQPEPVNDFSDVTHPPNLEIPVQNFNSSKSLETITLDPEVFAQPVRRDIVHRVVKWQLARRRQGTHKQKNISEVSGSGRKPWQQKGTGRARAGHRRPPHWRGGARAFAKRPRDYSYKLQKRVRNQGMRSALSAKVLEGALHIVDGETLESHKTAPLVSWLAERDIDSAVIVDADDSDNGLLEFAVGNIPDVLLLEHCGANVYDIVKRRDLIM